MERTPMTPAQQSDDDSDTAQIEPVVEPDIGGLLRRATNLLSEGRLEPAIGLCQQVIRENPEATDAYVLLGMAQEEQGNLHLAIEAYEQALSIDPERSTERDSIARLEEQLAEEAVAREPERGRLQRLARVAPIVLGVAVAFLVIVGAAALILRIRHGRQIAAQQEAYQAAMQQGQDLIAEGHYEEAIAAFRKACQVWPDDLTARKWWRRAYTLAGQQVEYEGYVQRSGAGKLSLKPAANPFAPVPIGPQSAQPKSSSTAGGTSLPTSSIPAWDMPPPTPPGQEGPGPLQLPEDLPTGEAGSNASTTGPDIAAPSAGGTNQRPEGEITIWVSEPQQQRRSGSTGDELRAAADRLRYDGRYPEAIQKYQQAREQYHREGQQDPITAPAKKSAIESCDQSIKILRDQSGE